MMTQVALDWKQGLSFSGNAPDGFTVDLDAEVGVGGAGGGFSPLELLALGLGGCTGMDVISILKKKRQDVTAFEVRVKTERAAEHPKVWTQVLVEYYVTGKNIDPQAVERAIQLSANKYCPAQNMLNKAVRIETRYEIRGV
ncbi:MAG: OsmC family protein [Anaerolineales bacterium]